MNLWFRLLWLLVSRILPGRREPCDVLGPCRTPFRVHATDLDLLGHVNNGKYFSLLDLGRIDLLDRSGLLTELFRRGWYPIVIGETIQFYRSLRFLQPFVVETSILGWDDRSFIVRQAVRRRAQDAEQVIADAIVRGLILKSNGSRAHPDEVLGLVDYEEDSPLLPEWVAEWIDAQNTTREQRKTQVRREGA